MSELPRKWVTCDPGESTGYAVWKGNTLVHAGTVELWQFVRALGYDVIQDQPGLWEGLDQEVYSRVQGWGRLVMEDWHLYRDKAQALIGDAQDTVRGIGALQFICQALDRPYTLQPAAIKSAAVTAGAEDLFLRPLHDNRHANDAIMHGVYYAGMQGKGIVQAD